MLLSPTFNSRFCNISWEIYIVLNALTWPKIYEGFLYIVVLRSLSALTIIVLTFVHCFADNELPVVIISIDAETKSISLPEQMDLVSKGGISFGLREMVRMLNERGYSGTFFLNVYEYKSYGETALKEIARWLINSGQDVQLHTHPQWAYDKDRPYMYQYNFAEQVKIIEEGKELLEKWTGRKIIAHRAGAYAADRNTLCALLENGIYFDSSMFWGYENCKITSLSLSKNVLSKFGPLYEFPVTVYNRKDYLDFFGEKIYSRSMIRKIDINWLSDPSEAQIALDTAIENKFSFIMLFLHSYSFIKKDIVNGGTIPDVRAIENFKFILAILDNYNIKVVSFADIAKGKFNLDNFLDTSDAIPEVLINITLAEYIRNIIKSNKFEIIFCTGILLFLVYILALHKRIIKKR
jgi:peptidoglycan/xylan/chitin deacetylase (PgdA/CDA1 family)